MTTSAAFNARIVDDLYCQGWSVQIDYFCPDLIQQLAVEALLRFQAKQMALAGIGRGQRMQHNLAIRQDAIYWIQQESAAQVHYQDILEVLRQTLNCRLLLGLFEFEAHFAVYQPAAFYKKHLDSFMGAADRIVSSVTYLNPDWPLDGGGELILYACDSNVIIQTIRPQAGTLVVFLSEEIAHEVRVTHQQRMSIAGWFKLNSYLKTPKDTR